MPAFTINPSLFAVFGLTTILVSLKALVLGTLTAATRGKLKSFINAEDAAWLGGAHINPDPEAVARLGRAQRNDLENLLPFFICGLFYALCGGQPTMGYVYCGAFLVSRILHTIAYVSARPMLRRNTYTVGFLTILAVGIHAAILLSLKI